MESRNHGATPFDCPELNIIECSREDDYTMNKILMLNDDCFLEIFKHLTLLDLANFKEAYKSRGSLADIEFSRRTRGSLGFGYKDNVSEDKVLRVIEKFGTSIKELKFKDVSWSRTIWCDIFTVIKEHCGEKLQSLALCGDGVELIEKKNIRSIADILNNVKKVTLENRHDHINHFILSYCVNVVWITLASEMDIFKSETMFRQNVNLLKLKLCGPITHDKMTMIVNNLMHCKLEELVLKFSWSSCTNRNLHLLIRLNCLKRLSIGCTRADIQSGFLPHVNDFNSLDVLSLSNIRLDAKCIAALGQINRLKVLKLRCDCGQVTITDANSHFDAVLALCGNKNFEHLLLFCCKRVINETRYLQLVRKRKESTADSQLYLTLRHEIYTASTKAIPSKVLEANSGTLMLIDEWDRNYVYYDSLQSF